MAAHFSMNKNFLYRILPCFACLLICTIVDLFYFPATTAFPDEQRFLASAVQLAENGEFWISGDRAWEMPGTALFYTPMVWLFGPHSAIVPIRLTQAILLAIQCALVASIARRLFGELSAIIASAIVAFYPFLIFYQGLLLSETLFNTFLLGGVAALFWWRERGLRIDFVLILAMLCFALATLTKATLTIFPPFLLAAAAWAAGQRLRRVAAILAAALFIYAVFMSPWWIRNAHVLHAFVPFTTSSASNLYLGNNANNPDVGIDWASQADPKLVAGIAALPDELARQQAYRRAAIDYIKSDPATFVLAAVKKFFRFWNIVPNASEYRTRLYYFVSAFSFGPILALALFCAIRRRQQWRQLAPLYLLVGYFTSVHIVTIASLRYRLPLEPLLIVLSAQPLAEFARYLRRRFSPTA
jgi:4-amino-4-deoxy-L-arabinose transferase-like glycosyltransferase